MAAFSNCSKLQLISNLMIILLFNSVATDQISLLYKSILKNTGLTVAGSGTSFNEATKIRCGATCRERDCTVWTFDKDGGFCTLLVLEIFPHMEAVDGSATLSTYVNPTTPDFTFIKVITDALSWDDAKAKCEAMGETMLHVPTEAEAIRLFNTYDKFYDGTYRIAPGVLSDLHGNTYDEANYVFSPEDTYTDSFQLCMNRWTEDGYHDAECDWVDATWAPKVAFCSITS